LKEATSLPRKEKIKESIKLFETNDIFNKLIEKRFNNPEKYCLTISDIYSIYPDLEKNKEFKKDINENILYNKIVKNEQNYYEWSLMNYVIVEYSDTKNDCANYLKFLTELDGLYKTLLIYNNDYLEQCKVKQDECAEYYSKIESEELTYYKQELKNSEKKITLIENANRIIIEKFRLPSFITSLTKIMESPFKIKTKNTLTSIISYLKPIQETIKIMQESNILGDIKPQKVIGKSIIEGKSSFSYVYNPDSDGIVYKQLYSDMKSFLISDTDIYHIIKQFCPFFNHDKTEIIYNISHVEDYNKSFILSIEKIEDLLEQTHFAKNVEVEENLNEESENSNLHPHLEDDTDIEEADF
jgi:hypothetical protein